MGKHYQITSSYFYFTPNFFIFYISICFHTNFAIACFCRLINVF